MAHNYKTIVRIQLRVLDDTFLFPDEPQFRLLLRLYGQKKKPGIGENPNPVAVKCPFVTVPVYVEPFSRHNPVAIAVLYGANSVAVATFWT